MITFLHARHTRLAPVASFASLLLATAAHATILTFDVGAGSSVNYLTYPDLKAYGDNVNSTGPISTPGGFSFTYGVGNGFTPNVTIGYDDGTAPSLNIPIGNDAPNNWDWVAYLFGNTSGAADRTYYITFTPASGYQVRVNSFDLFHYTGNGPTGTVLNNQIPMDWRLYDNVTLVDDGAGHVTSFA